MQAGETTAVHTGKTGVKVVCKWYETGNERWPNRIFNRTPSEIGTGEDRWHASEHGSMRMGRKHKSFYNHIFLNCMLNLPYNKNIQRWKV